MKVVLPARVVDVLPEGTFVVEVGVGARWDTITRLSRHRPDLRLLATDIRSEALQGAPTGVQTVQDDVFDPDPAVYTGAGLLYAVRCPAELQPPLARLARSVGATLAVRALKDELGPVDRILGEPTLQRAENGDPWRLWSTAPATGAARSVGEHA